MILWGRTGSVSIGVIFRRYWSGRGLAPLQYVSEYLSCRSPRYARQLIHRWGHWSLPTWRHFLVILAREITAETCGSSTALFANYPEFIMESCTIFAFPVAASSSIAVSACCYDSVKLVFFKRHMKHESSTRLLCFNLRTLLLLLPAPRRTA